MINKIKNDNLINDIIKHSDNVQIYLVGGCVRNFILNKENFDKDIIAECENVKEYAQNLANSLDATFIVLDDENKIYRLVLKDKINCIDIAGVIGNNIEEDLRRRDFTINSVAVNLKNYEILDINNGLKDIEDKIIRGITDKNFKDDPLRLLRAYRFQSSLGFKIDEYLKQIIDNNYKDLNKISIERINTELVKLFDGRYAHETLKNMDEMLIYLFPVMNDVKTIPPNSHHHLPLFLHSIETVKQVQTLYENSKIKNELKPRLSLLKLSAFLHDIGKPQTWTIEEDTGRHRFIKHDDVGSKLVVPLLKNLNFSKKQINYISLMIKDHIYPSQVIVSQGDIKKSYMRFVRKMGEYVPDIIYLAMADRLSAQGPAITKEITEANINGLSSLLQFYLDVRDTLKPLPVLIDGNEIMEKFNIKPSPILGKIINHLKEAQISGEVNTKSEAECYIRNILTDLL